MVKPSKKKGKKDSAKDQTPSSVQEEEPSTSEIPPPPAEGEDDSNLSAAERKRKERKEKKEKARLTMEASRKPSRLDSTSESASETMSRAASEAPSEPSVEVPEKVKTDAPPEAPAEVAKPAAAEAAAKPEPEAEEESGLGLLSSKKRKPRKKKGAAEGQQPAAPAGPAAPAAPAASAAPAAADQRSVSASSSSSQLVSPSTSGPTPVLVQMPEPQKTAAPGPWGRGRGWSAAAGPSTSTAMPPPRTSPLTPTAAPIPTPQPVVAQQTPLPTRPPKSLEPVLCRYKIPNKIPGGMVRARAIRVMVNYLEMTFKTLQISRYDVSFSPDRPKRMLPEVFQKVKAEFFSKDLIAFDQMKNCYSLRPLKNVTSTERFNTRVEIIDQNGRPMNFEVSMKATGVVDLGNIQRYMANRSSSLCHPTEEIQCIDVILRQGALESYVKAGRQFFKRPLRPVDLGSGYEMWTGLFQSAIFTNKAFINIDVAHKGFPKHQSVLDALVKDFGLDPTRNVDHQRGGEQFSNFVKGLKVVATLVGNTPSAGHRREFVCNGMVGPPDELTFTITEPDGRTRKTTVGEYFARDKKYRLKFPKLNCLWVGSRDRCIYFPIELLQVAYGQPLTRQLNEQQVAKMVKEAATPPDERLQKITEVISNMKYSQNKDFKQFGLEISDKFYTVKAKVLEPPTLEIGNGKIVPRRGQWQANRLLKPEHLQSWGLVALDTDPRNNYDEMISLIISTGNQMGMSVARPKMVMVSARMTSLHNILMNAYRDVKFLFIIVSSRGRDDYHKVKQMAEREVGILTQCVKEMTARRMNPMTARNILLKVNSKLMGINQAIDTVTMPKCLKDGGVMIVGADVTHPSPDQSNIPSIAAVTASIDPKCYMYNIELSIQTPKKEMIVEFEDMMFDHLKVYKERNHNALPRKIFVFRDGVSEGQFAQVMNSELAAVHNAYQRMAGQSRKPEVLFLLVQKRHHTRLFNEGVNKQQNVEPGTVVDTDIVHSSELDFYLVSHQAIKGTARPTRYHAVCNDGKIPDDEVEQLTYYLCHLYSRCMRSVSYPTPTYYAHLACLRARSLTHGEKFDNKELERKPKRLHVLDKMLQFSRMFFV
ncbi:protein argonaute-2 [Helicoverpa armigera]|uniref:protein argonaute-2 n=1 Tax=Helicoverpa armigera TaxID=29058 RepID=UPI003083BA64